MNLAENQDQLPEEIVLRDEETIEKTFTRSYLSYVMTRIIPGIIGLIVCFVIVNLFITYYVGDILSILAPGQSTQIIIFIDILLCIIGIPLLVLAFILGPQYCRSHLYIATSKRVIFFKKFIIISRRDIDWERITDFVVLQGPIGRWQNYGDIRPVTAGIEFMCGLGGVLNSFNGIIDPYNTKKEIMKIFQKYRKD